MEDRQILDCIHALVAQERRLRDEHGHDPEGKTPDHEHLVEVKRNLDQMWDLLRRRRAMRAAGQNPDSIDVRGTLHISA